MKRFISFSGGVESTAMCLFYGENSDAIFADTGFEHKLLYERIDQIQEKIREFHGNNFTIHRVSNGSLQDYIQKQKFYPSFNARFCTRLFKIKPIDDYLRQFSEEGVELMIGLNCDEEGQRTGNHGLLPFVKYSYPLIENKISRKLCESALNVAGLHPNFPVYMRRGGCKGCFYKSKKEYEAMVHLAPEEFDELIALEESIQDNRKEFYSIKKDMGRFKDFKEKVLSQGELFDFKSIYSYVNSETPCGVFCNR